MELIKRLGYLKTKHSWGIFLCPYCLSEVKKDLSNGQKAKSCGCNNIGNLKHGETDTRLYRIYHNIKSRCLNPKATSYEDYGGKGIAICKEWLEFINFRNWALQNGYKNNLTINRIENDLDYYPDNCEWITKSKNSQKRTTTKLTELQVKEIRIKYDSGYYTMKKLAKKYKVSIPNISYIINNESWRNI